MFPIPETILDSLPAPAPRGGVLAPADNEDVALASMVRHLRASGERVVTEFPGQEAFRAETGCDRRLVLANGTWQVQTL